MHALRLFLFLSLTVVALEIAAQEERAKLVFAHVTVIDCTGAPAKPDMTVVVEGDRISSLGRADGVSIQENSQVIDCSGKYMIPGLWDMHVHRRPWANALFLANGVTGRRIMWGAPIHLWERANAGRKEDTYEGRIRFANSRPIPILRSSVASPIVDGPESNLRDAIPVKNADQARRLVHTLQDNGYDFVKVYSHLPRDCFFAIAEEANKSSFRFAGHVPYSVTVAEASDAGLATIEHLTGIYASCSAKEAEVREQFPAPVALRLSRDTYDEAKGKALFAKFAKNGTWQVPTLTVLKWGAFADREEFVHDPRLRFIERREEQRWQDRGRQWVARYRNLPLQRRDFQQDLQVVGEMHKAGVRLLAGTDMGNPFCMPGFSLHDELELFVKAGLSPMEALQTATSSPAEYLGKSKELGTVETGKLADLVLLDANPLEDINAVRGVAGVVFAGRFYAKDQLARILAERELENELLICAESCDEERMASLARNPLLGEVEHVTLERSHAIDADTRWLTILPELRSIDLRRAKVSNEGLSLVGKLRKLQVLKLLGNNIEDRGTAALTGLGELKVLWLDNTRLSDAGLKSIAELDTLTDLSLTQTAIGDDGLSHLKPLRQLSKIWLGDTNVTDEGLQHLREFEHLTYIGLKGTQITDDGLRHVGALRQLENLGLRDTRITDAGISHLLGLQHLKSLRLQNTQVTDAGISRVSTLKSLETLDIKGVKVTDGTLRELQAALPKLTISR